MWLLVKKPSGCVWICGSLRPNPKSIARAFSSHVPDEFLPRRLGTLRNAFRKGARAKRKQTTVRGGGGGEFSKLAWLNGE